jgi:hypothetical protein
MRISCFLLLFLILQYTAAAQTADVYSTDREVIAGGEALFLQHCASCHNFKQRGIGPDLSGITAKASKSWLLEFIHDPKAVLEKGDTYAQELFKEYNVLMPSFTYLKDEEKDKILAFINIHKKESKVALNHNFGAPIADPVPEKIMPAGLTLKLEPVLTAPFADDKIPRARINQMRVLKGRKSRVFLSDLRGQLYEMKEGELYEVFNISKAFPAFIPEPGLATGFGSYAFHPDFYKNGLFYTTHTEKAGTAKADFNYNEQIPVALQWVLSEWSIDRPDAAIFTGSHREILRIDMPSQVHGVQEIIFNPLAKKGDRDYGLLYIGIGDGGSGESGYSQLCIDNTQVWSSVLRIDPLGSNSKNGRYGIPDINPFVRDGDPASLGEIFAIGFRNPNRISWSPDGKMLISDIGLSNAEELNIGNAGGHYGWPVREGTFLLNYKGKMDKVYALPENDAAYTYPVVQYDHDEGNAFSAGFVYTGPIKVLEGKYIFGDVVTGRVFYVNNSDLILGKQAKIKELELDFNGSLSTFRQITANSRVDLRFGVGAKNELYLYTKTDGKIWKVKNCQKSVVN